MKKFLSVLLAVMMLMTIASVTSLADEKVQIRYVTWDSEDYYIKPLVEKFNASQDRIEVIYDSFPTLNDEYVTKVLNMLSVEGQLDVFSVRDMSYFADYVKYNALLPLNDLIAEKKVDLLPYGSTISSCQLDETYYAMPYRKSVWFLMYSPNFFEKMGMENPGIKQMTWAEAEEMAKALTTYNADGTQATFGWGGQWISLASNESLRALGQYGQLITDDDCSAYKKVLERLYQYYKVDKTPQDYATAKAIGKQGSGVAFYNYQCAFNINSDFTLGMMRSDAVKSQFPEGFTYNITYLPIDEGMEPHTSFGSVVSTAINAETKHPKEAFEFLTYLCGEEGATELAKFSVLPAYSSKQVEDTYRSNALEGLNVDVLFNSIPLQDEAVTDKAAELTEMTFEEVERLYIEGATPDQVYESWNKRRLEILGK